MPHIASHLLAATVLAGLAGSATAQELQFPIGEGPFSWDAYQAFSEKHDFPDQSLSVFSAATGPDKLKLERVFDYFEAATGASVELSGSDSLEQDIIIAAQSATLPDIAMLPQPGLAADLAARGVLVPLDDAKRDWFRENFAAGESWLSYVTYPGPQGEEHVYATIFGADVKSLVWYVPEIFDENGYDIPETMEDLKALTEQIVSDGGTPWCIGLGAGAATGWPATDWVEDMMLRTVSPDVYDAWVSNTLPFNAPQVVNAIEEYGWFARNDAHVAGGAQAVATQDFRDNPNGLFSFPPECFLHRQASFIPNFFPEGTVVGEDVDFFYFPAFASADLGRPILGSGGVVSITADSPLARAFIEYLDTPFAHEVGIAQGQALTAHLGANVEAYPTEAQRAMGEILTSATTFRFDGSDLMPGEIGTSAFWSAMVDYQTGASAEDAAKSVEDRWKQIR